METLINPMSHPYPDRRRKLENGKRINVYFDTSTIELAKHIGDGNLSQGIRVALEYYAKTHSDTGVKMSESLS